jgi:hypothetical protein
MPIAARAATITPGGEQASVLLMHGRPDSVVDQLRDRIVGSRGLIRQDRCQERELHPPELGQRVTPEV